MGAKSEQLLVLKEEEKLLLTFRSRVNDQLNRLKVTSRPNANANRLSVYWNFVPYLLFFLQL